jgi:hypothetical protein
MFAACGRGGREVSVIIVTVAQRANGLTRCLYDIRPLLPRCLRSLALWTCIVAGRGGACCLKRNISVLSLTDDCLTVVCIPVFGKCCTRRVSEALFPVEVGDCGDG